MNERTNELKDVMKKRVNECCVVKEEEKEKKSRQRLLYRASEIGKGAAVGSSRVKRAKKVRKEDSDIGKG